MSASKNVDETIRSILTDFRNSRKGDKKTRLTVSVNKEVYEGMEKAISDKCFYWDFMSNSEKMDFFLKAAEKNLSDWELINLVPAHIRGNPNIVAPERVLEETQTQVQAQNVYDQIMSEPSEPWDHED